MKCTSRAIPSLCERFLTPLRTSLLDTYVDRPFQNASLTWSLLNIAGRTKYLILQTALNLAFCSPLGVFLRRPRLDVHDSLRYGGTFLFTTSVFYYAENVFSSNVFIFRSKRSFCACDRLNTLCAYYKLNIKRAEQQARWMFANY